MMEWESVGWGQGHMCLGYVYVFGIGLNAGGGG